MKELEKQSLTDINGGAIMSTITAIVTIASVVIYLYNEGHDFVEGVKDGIKGEYKNDPDE